MADFWRDEEECVRSAKGMSQGEVRMMLAMFRRRWGRTTPRLRRACGIGW